MLKIRLKRTGKRNDPHYRIVVMPARSKRDGKAVEYIGYYNPRTKEINLKAHRAKHWISVGAQPTATVKSILMKEKVIKKEKWIERPAKKPKKETDKKVEETKPKKAETKKEEKPKEAKRKKQVASKEEKPKEEKKAKEAPGKKEDKDTRKEKEAKNAEVKKESKSEEKKKQDKDKKEDKKSRKG